MQVSMNNLPKRILRHAVRRSEQLSSEAFGVELSEALTRASGRAHAIKMSEEGAKISWERKRMSAERQRRVVEESVSEAMANLG